jgi:hypothetical protein
LTEKPIDLSSQPPDASFITLESSHFSKRGFMDSLTQSLEELTKAKIFLMLSEVSRILLHFLEKNREFSHLKYTSWLLSHPYGQISD